MLAASAVVGALFGLSLAAPPGPMNAVIAQESVLRGWWSGFRTGLGAMTADLCFFLLSLAGVTAFLQDRPTIRAVMVGLGGVLMLVFAVDALRDALSGRQWATAAESRGFSKAFVLALTNPYQILFWLTVGVGLLQSGRADLLSHAPYVGDRLAGRLVVRTGSPALLAGFFGGIVVWIAAFPAALVGADRELDRFATVVAVGSAAVLAGFGVWFLVDAATGLR